MKVLCNTCGCHFPDEFEQTLEPKCNFWGTKGFSNLPVEDKKEIWDWSFSLDLDKYLVKYQMSFVCNWFGYPVETEDEFKNAVEGWENMSETERRAYEKKFFKERLKKKAEEEHQKAELLRAASDKNKLLN